MTAFAHADTIDRRRQAQLARNEHLFRGLNEAIEQQAERIEAAAGEDEAPHTYEFACECADPACTTMVPLRLEEYLAVRAADDTFVIAAGHDLESIERVVDRASRYWVVQKVGTAGAVARDLAA